MRPVAVLGPSGMYVVRLQADGQQKTRRITVVE